MNDPTINSAATLTVICGPMFAGKSTLLLTLMRQSAEPRLLIKPAADTRYADSDIVTHDGDRSPAVSVSQASQIPGLVTNHRTVGIDEAHFFGADLTPVVRALLKRNITLIVAGIERDHLGDPFEPFPSLLCDADSVTKLFAICAICAGKAGRAIHSQRMFTDTSRIVVGGANLYQARCRHCFDPHEPRT